MNNCIAIDWLQLHVAIPYRDFDTLVKPANFIIQRQEIQTRNFKTLYSVLDKETKEEIAVIAAEPRNEMCMRSDSALIKIINKYLYQKNFSDFVRYLLKDLQLTFINITRIDLAYDFLKFDTMSCPDFINNFASCQYLKKFQCKFKMMGDSWSVDKGELTGGISSLKFGLESSDVSYYLYNKTLELQQIKMKPWIHEHWRANGWDGVGDVYRLEFSLHPDTRGIMIVDEDGQLHETFHFKDLSFIDNISLIYQHYFTKHFQFVVAEKTKKGNYKKQSRCESLVLFNSMQFASCTIKLSSKKDSGRSSKIFAKKLVQLNQELRGTDFDLGIAGNEIMTWVIKIHALEEWQKKKMPGVHLSDRVVDLVNRGRVYNLETELLHMRDMPAIFKSGQQQQQELINIENNIRSGKFDIQPDGKIANYNDDGSVNSYTDPMF